jgi:hypothetical protein
VREIQSIDVRPQNQWGSRDEGGSFEVVIVKENDDVIQLYNGASFTVLRIARRLREELGVRGEDREC